MAEGTGSSRLSPGTRAVASVLNQGAIGTLLPDLVTDTEETSGLAHGALPIAIPLMAARLVCVTHWIRNNLTLTGLALGHFGNCAGAAAALVAAGSRPRLVRAFVSHSGQTDLAGRAMGRVDAPCLFIVGANDRQVLRMNREAISKLLLRTYRRLEVVRRATHLFEEQGALERVAELARGWFEQYFVRDADFRSSLQAVQIKMTAGD